MSPVPFRCAGIALPAALVLSLAATALRAQAQVQTEWPVDPASVEACLEAEADCIGAAAGRCMEETEDGQTTIGMSGCTQAETEIWDRLLNETYGTLRAELDAVDARGGLSGGQGIDRSDALRDAQRAWIAYRDAECRLRWVQFQDGTIRSILAAACQLDFTARRTFELRDMGRMEGR